MAETSGVLNLLTSSGPHAEPSSPALCRGLLKPASGAVTRQNKEFEGAPLPDDSKRVYVHTRNDLRRSKEEEEEKK